MISPLAADVADLAFKQAFEAYDGECGFALLDALETEGLASHPGFAELFREIDAYERASLSLEDHETSSAGDWLADHGAQRVEQLADPHLERLDQQEVAARVKRAILRSEVAMGRVRRSL
jgi:hypothetical protein